MKQKFKQDRGVAGLSILLSLVVMLFVIGLLVMIFSLMGGELQTATYTPTTLTVVNETITGLNETAGDTLAKYPLLRDVVCTSVVVKNATTGVAYGTGGAGNWTVSNCQVYGVNGVASNGQNAKVDYTYLYQADTLATNTMNSTTTGVGNAVDWFDIFIVIGAMVVLILLTVIIISAIKSSGMISGAGSQSGANSVGTA